MTDEQTETRIVVVGLKPDDADGLAEVMEREAETGTEFDEVMRDFARELRKPSTRPAPDVAEHGEPTLQGVVDLAEAIYDHRNAYGAALAAWAELPDEPEAVIAILVGSGDYPSPTQLAESLKRVSGDLRKLTVALGTGEEHGG